jgi:heat shock protein HslJ
VIRIDDDPLEDPHEDASLSFPNLDDAVLTTMCGESTAGLALDTDGSAIGFAPFASHDCPPEVEEFESRIIDALSGLEQWRVDSESEIRFLGRHVVFLERIPE